MPPPAPLLDESKYVGLPRQQQQQQQQLQHQQQQQQQQVPSSRPSHHNHLLHRPYSFTSGMLFPDVLSQGQNLGS